MTTTPAHEHDCTRCTYLGTVPRMSDFVPRNVSHADLYHCVQSGGIPTILVRYGPCGEYHSGYDFHRDIEAGNEIGEALRRALNLGLKL